MSLPARFITCCAVSIAWTACASDAEPEPARDTGPAPDAATSQPSDAAPKPAPDAAAVTDAELGETPCPAERPDEGAACESGGACLYDYGCCCADYVADTECRCVGGVFVCGPTGACDPPPACADASPFCPPPARDGGMASPER